VTALQQQIYELRSAHTSAALQSLDELRRRLLLSIEPVAYKDVLTPEEEASLQDAAAQVVDRYGPDCPERRAVRDFHFDQLHRLLLPPHTKFLLWLMHQHPEFFSAGDKDKPKGGAGAGAGAAGGASGAAASSSSSSSSSSSRPPLTLWTLLCAEIGLPADGAEKLRAALRRVLGGPDLPRETWRLGVATAYLQRLRAAVAAAAAKAQGHLERVREILTPAQLIRYLAWMEKNKERVSRAIEQTVVPPNPQQAAAQAAAVNISGRRRRRRGRVARGRVPHLPCALSHHLGPQPPSPAPSLGVCGGGRGRRGRNRRQARPHARPPVEPEHAEGVHPGGVCAEVAHGLLECVGEAVDGGQPRPEALVGLDDEDGRGEGGEGNVRGGEVAPDEEVPRRVREPVPGLVEEPLHLLPGPADAGGVVRARAAPHPVREARGEETGDGGLGGADVRLGHLHPQGAGVRVPRVQEGGVGEAARGDAEGLVGGRDAVHLLARVKQGGGGRRAAVAVRPPEDLVAVLDALAGGRDEERGLGPRRAPGGRGVVWGGGGG
jgi:hypothetical protein